MSKTVLVLDDEIDILDIIKGLLETFDDIKTVVTASKFSDAYTKLRNQRFDYIISDYNLQGSETGIDFIKEVRTQDQQNCCKTHVLLVSAFLNKEIVTQAAHYKVQDIIVKPFSLKQIQNIFGEPTSDYTGSIAA